MRICRQYGRSMLASLRASKLEVRYSFPQFALHGTAFFFPHVIQAMKRLVQLGEHRRRELFFGRRSGRVERAWKPEHSVQVRFGRDASFSRGRPESLDVSRNQLPIK